MKLIKCSRCGRPFYNDEKACPYCGQATHLSSTNFVTRPISEPKSHKLMEDFFSGNYQPKPIAKREETAKTESVPDIPAVEPESTVEETTQETMAVTDPNPMMAEEPSQTVLERADNIAAATQQTEETTNDETMTSAEEPAQADTEHLPRKRHGWIWILVIVIILAIAAAVYLKWDFVYGKVTSLLN